MAQATVTFELGPEVVTSILEIDVDDETTLIGNIGGLIPFGTTARIVGNVNLTSDLIVEGLLTGIDTFTLEGNGFQILVQHGGVLDLAGVEKSGWVRWGEPVVGWQTGELLVVAPIAPGIFSVSVSNWGGSWATTTRPPNCPDFTLPPNPYQTVAKPEVANFTRSITLQNLSRIHFHDDPGVQTLKWLEVVNSGVSQVLGKYPIHFHFAGEAVRGSLVEGVLVKGGKNHAFVVHASHGVTLRDCVAYNTFSDAFWYDPPPSFTHEPINNPNDLTYEHCFAFYVSPPPGTTDHRLTGFLINAGFGNSVTDSVATCVRGGNDTSGFHWSEHANDNVGGNVWEFQNNVAHNNLRNGILVWQNDARRHPIEDFIAYRNGVTQIDHGAYHTHYDYKRLVLSGLTGDKGAFRLHALGDNLLEDIYTDRPLRIVNHRVDSTQFTVVRRCNFPQVIYQETLQGGVNPSNFRYDDSNLNPSKFDMAGALLASVAEVYQAGVLLHRWTAGVWT